MENQPRAGWQKYSEEIGIALVCLTGIAWYFTGRSIPKGESKSSETSRNISDSSAEDAGTSNPVKIGIAYGTEKRRWLNEALAQFQQTEEGKRIEIELIPMGSLEGAHAVLNADKRIHVWSPASSMYRDVFVQDWEIQHPGRNPIGHSELLALSPMVFVAWGERADAFLESYSEISFRTIAEALHEEGGWGSIAKKPEWGLFKFGHTHPNQSNSGLIALALMAYDYQEATTGLKRAAIVDPEFQSWLTRLERGVTGLTNSTGNLMKEMVLKGPSSFDVVLVYENVAIDYLKNAEGRWGELHVVYPKYNLWNDNPYYILNTPWSSSKEQDAARTFLKFLMTNRIQQSALNHGFRPGNPAVATNVPESPLVRYERYGLRIEFPGVCGYPPPEVLSELQAFWQRSGRR